MKLNTLDRGINKIMQVHEVAKGYNKLAANGT